VTISVVQSTTVASAFSGNFAANVTAGNTVFIAVVTFNTSNVTISSSAPTFAGSSVPGALQLFTIQATFNAGAGTVYCSVWMLPAVAGGSKAVGVTVTNGTTGTNVGLLIYEVAGLGATPALDKSSTGQAASTTAVSSGSSGNITQAPEFVIGAAAIWNGMPPPTSPWTSQGIGASPDSACAGYQIPTSSGSAYTYSGTQATGGDPWSAGVATVYAQTAVAVAAPRQLRPAAARRPARAVVRFTPVATVNAAPSGTPGTVPVLMVNRTELLSRRDGRVVQG
jgi:hypothetical protein